MNKNCVSSILSNTNYIMVYNTELSGCIDMNTKPCGNVNHTIASNTELDG